MACHMMNSRYWRLIMTAALLGLCGVWAVAVPSPQDEGEDSTRRIWNKRFREARDRTRTKRPVGTVGKKGLIGVTIWRVHDGQDVPTAERATADTNFREGERVQISVEVPREGDSYLYVIDREVYADGTTSDPYLIFPSQTTPLHGNVVTAGRPVYVPGHGDPPYFTLDRSRKDQVHEALTFIVSSRPLKLPIGAPANPAKLDRTQVARWEKQWGGRIEQREERGGAGKQWTLAERKAGNGERRLVQGDPLPQTMYRVSIKPGAPIMLHVPLQIAP